MLTFYLHPQHSCHLFITSLHTPTFASALPFLISICTSAFNRAIHLPFYFPQPQYELEPTYILYEFIFWTILFLLCIPSDCLVYVYIFQLYAMLWTTKADPDFPVSGSTEPSVYICIQPAYLCTTLFPKALTKSISSPSLQYSHSSKLNESIRHIQYFRWRGSISFSLKPSLTLRHVLFS